MGGGRLLCMSPSGRVYLPAYTFGGTENRTRACAIGGLHSSDAHGASIDRMANASPRCTHREPLAWRAQHSFSDSFSLWWAQRSPATVKRPMRGGGCAAAAATFLPKHDRGTYCKSARGVLAFARLARTCRAWRRSNALPISPGSSRCVKAAGGSDCHSARFSFESCGGQRTTDTVSSSLREPPTHAVFLVHAYARPAQHSPGEAQPTPRPRPWAAEHHCHTSQPASAQQLAAQSAALATPRLKSRPWHCTPERSNGKRHVVGILSTVARS